MSRLESPLRALFFVCVAAGLLAAGAFFWAAVARREALVDLRDAVFASTRPADLFYQPPDQLVAAGFRADPESLVAEWSRRVPEEIPYMQGVAQQLAGRNEIEKVKTLVPLFSKNGGGGCGHYQDLVDQLLRLPRGNGVGCCSDHVQAFLALASTVGVFARQVHHHTIRHTTAEFWVPELARWVWVDPQYALLARDRDGAYLSLGDVRDRYRAGEPVDFEFIGNRYHRFAHESPQKSDLYDEAADFVSIGWTWGNNVFEEDRLHHTLQPLPFMLRQALGLASGVLPGLRFPEPGDDPKAVYFARIRARSWTGVVLLVLGLLAWPTLRLLRRPAS